MKYICLFLAFFSPFILSAQKNFQPGYIVNMKGDTISGLIDYKEWSLSPTSILFKPSDNNANSKEYGLNDISFFDISGKEAYMRSVVKISLNPAKVDNIGGRDTSWKIDTIFLKIIHSGKLASLLSYTDKLKERFYLFEKDAQQPTELIMRKYVGESALTVISENIYKEQLKRFFYVKSISTDKLIARIDQSEYEEFDLNKIMVLADGVDDPKQIGAKKKRFAYWFAGAGLQSQEIKFSGDHQFAKNVSGTESTWLPRISAGLDLLVNPNVGKLSYRVEGGYQINKSIMTAALPDDVKAVYQLSSSTISFQAQFNYAVYNSAKLKIPLGFGLIYSHNSYSKNEYKKRYVDGTENNHVEDWLSLKKSTTTYFGRASAIFHNKVEVSFLYRPFTNLIKASIYSVATNNMQLQAYYLFRQKK